MKPGPGNTISVIIAGAGPAGLSAARTLEDAGMDYLLLDRASFPREKLCGGLLSGKTVRLLDEHWGISRRGLLASGAVTRQLDRCRIHLDRQLEISGRSPDPLPLVHRPRYDAWLAGRLSPGRRRFGIAVTGVDAAGRTIQLANGERLRFGWLLACDGVNSRLRRQLRPDCHAAARRGSAFCLQLSLPREQTVPGLRDAFHIFLDGFHRGYGWAFDHGDSIHLGAASGRPGLPSLFAGWLAGLGQSPAGKPRGHFVPYGWQMADPSAGPFILFAGDAAGFADPVTGEGIYFAHLSGHLAARAVLAAAAGGGAAHSHYRELARKPLLRELQAASLVHRYFFTGRLGRRLLLGLGPAWRRKCFLWILRIIQGETTYRDTLGRHLPFFRRCGS